MPKEKKRRADEAIKLFEKFDALLRNKFNEIRDVSVSSQTKGTSYEEIVSEFFETYLSGQLEFHIKARLIDSNLDLLERLSTKENEFDVVGIYKCSIPKLILEVRSIPVIPYDAVAVVFEVKQTLNTDTLEKGLKKLSTLEGIQLTKNRWTRVIKKEHTFLDRPIRFLFAFESSISNEKLVKLLVKYPHGFDLLSVLDPSRIVVNRTLPICQRFSLPSNTPFAMMSEPSVFITTLIYFLESLPLPDVVDCGEVFRSLVYQRYFHPQYFGEQKKS